MSQIPLQIPRLATHPVPATPIVHLLEESYRHRAVRAVASHAVNAADCLALLEALGLDAAEGKADSTRDFDSPEEGQRL